MPPFILLSLLLGAIFGTIFYVWRGRSLRDLVIYLLTGIIGFAVGQAIAMAVGLDMWLIGPLHIAEATTVSWSSLFLINWLKI